ncbi:MAG TPA: RidA family protein [Gemmatimonadales bacterium]|nr:RidA family protein [Gemmatimonadales bacterium]
MKARYLLLTVLVLPVQSQAQSPSDSLRFASPTSLPPVRGYSQLVEIPAGSQLVFLSGQVPLDSAGHLAGQGHLDAQTTQVFENLRRALTAAGMTFQDVVKLTFYLTDATQLSAIRAVRDRYIDAHAPPASSLVEVRRLFQPGVLIEVDAVAARAPGVR